MLFATKWLVSLILDEKTGTAESKCFETGGEKLPRSPFPSLPRRSGREHASPAWKRAAGGYERPNAAIPPSARMALRLVQELAIAAAR